MLGEGNQKAYNIEIKKRSPNHDKNCNWNH